MIGKSKLLGIRTNLTLIDNWQTGTSIKFKIKIGSNVVGDEASFQYLGLATRRSRENRETQFNSPYPPSLASRKKSRTN